MSNTQAQGKIVQCIGAVVDVEFPRDSMPRVYDALKLDGTALTLGAPDALQHVQAMEARFERDPVAAGALRRFRALRVRVAPIAAAAIAFFKILDIP